MTKRLAHIQLALLQRCPVHSSNAVCAHLSNVALDVLLFGNSENFLPVQAPLAHWHARLTHQKNLYSGESNSAQILDCVGAAKGQIAYVDLIVNEGWICVINQDVLGYLPFNRPKLDLVAMISKHKTIAPKPRANLV